MIMKKCMLAVSTLLLAGSSYAQTSFGILAGTTFSNPAIKTAGSSQQNKMRMGAVAGIYANLAVAPALYIHPALQYEMKGGKSKTTGRKTKLGYLTLPVDLMFKPHTGGSWFVGAGPYVGYGLSGKLTGGGDDFPAVDKLFKAGDGLKRMDAGAHLQAGYAFNEGLQIAIATEQGLLNLRKQGTTSNRFRNNAYSVTVGYTFGK
jgi:hypothetical protein